MNKLLSDCISMCFGFLTCFCNLCFDSCKCNHSVFKISIHISIYLSSLAAVVVKEKVEAKYEAEEDWSSKHLHKYHFKFNNLFSFHGTLKSVMKTAQHRDSE